MVGGASGVVSRAEANDNTLICLIGALTFGVAVALWLIRAILKPVYMLLGVLKEPDGSDTPSAADRHLTRAG